ncbi:hypothetical protein HG530_003069 [Fusarium avenaceum]|nr:hypothetical protein HG530_003069 [Fusarium avenaceum]
MTYCASSVLCHATPFLMQRPLAASRSLMLSVINDLLLLSSDLVGAVTVSQGNGAVLNSLEINSDTEGSTKLIVSAVSLTNAGGRIVDTAGDTGTTQTLFLADLDLAITDTRDLESDVAVLAQLLGKLLSLFLWRGEKSCLYSLGILLELRTELLPLNINLPLLNNERGLSLLTDNQGSTGLLGVDAQVVGTSVGAANTLDPTRAGEKLSVPTVASVMGHLIGHVLAESQLAHIYTNLLQEQVDSCNEVTQSLVINKTFLHSLANLDSPGSGLAGQLGITVKKNKLNILNLVESGVLLATLRVDEVLDLSHKELTHSQQTSTRGDLVSELGKVQELALGSLGTEVARVVAAGTNSGLEHKVERNGLCGLNSSGRVSEIVLLDELTELRAPVVVNSGKNLLVLLNNGIVELDSLGLGLLLLFLGVLLLILYLLATGLLITV